MIRSIRHKGLAALYHEDQTRGVQQAHVRRLRQILALLDSAATPDDMNTPGLRMHALRGNLGGYYSVSVSGNWRVIYRFEQGDVIDVDYVDYH
jgi:proteic killer suppression protein